MRLPSSISDPSDALKPVFLRWLLWTGLLLGAPALGVAAPAPAAELAETAAEDRAIPAAAKVFFETHCYDCHDGPGGEGDFDVTALSAQLDDETTVERWVRIFDRVHDGEMPPPDASLVEPDEAEAFLSSVGTWLRDDQRQQQQKIGRVRGRRLTRLQMERTLHDLLGIDIPLANKLPEEGRVGGFTTVADGQPMSHFQLQRHLAVVDEALDEAFRRASEPDDLWEKQLPAKKLARTRTRTREPELIDGRIVIWSSGLSFYGRIPATRAREDGWYRFTIRGIESLKVPEDSGVWSTIRSGQCVSSAPLMSWIDAFEATAEPQDITVEAWLPEGHMLEIRPGDTKLKKARFKGGQAENGEGGAQDVPGIAIDSITMQRIHKGPTGEEIRQMLFEDLPLKREGKRGAYHLVSQQPKEDAGRLMTNFAERAFRRPVDRSTVAPYIDLVHRSLDEGEPLLAALRSGYRALLCSPRFVYLYEEPGRLDDYAIASRLSYALWNTMPDGGLFRLASERKLDDEAVLREQIERMLDDPRGERFVEDFSAQWLDLDQIDFTEPDRKLYPDYDQIVESSMLAETHAFLQHMLDENLSVTHLIDSDFTFLNGHLADYYGIEGVEGDQLQQVSLDDDDRRGGVLTQGAILKVTANGTTTSPVIRGVWVSERLLGEEIPPPPKNVPAIEPDIRGATTIREMLAKHRSQDSCAACHVKIDPPGFALENYDAAGQWREAYPRLKGRRRAKGAPVDASYEMPDGQSFEDVSGFQSLIASRREQLAENVAAKLITYTTGAEITFADREVIAEIVETTADTDHGFRSIVHGVMTSPIFLSK